MNLTWGDFMNYSPFDIISKFCLDQGKDFVVRNHAFAIHTEKLKGALERHKKDHRGKITPEIEEALQKIHLNEEELREYVAEAERIIHAAEEKLLQPYQEQRRSRFAEFTYSFLASVLGTFFFTLLLFLLFLLAEDQIRPLFQRLIYHPSMTESLKQGQK